MARPKSANLGKGHAPVHRLVLVDHVQEYEDHHRRCSQHQKRADRCCDRSELGFGGGVEIALGKRCAGHTGLA